MEVLDDGKADHATKRRKAKREAVGVGI